MTQKTEDEVTNIITADGEDLIEMLVAVFKVDPEAYAGAVATLEREQLSVAYKESAIEQF